ncbi:MAG: heavy-metal-associated domain-containing protein [Gaiella sp.]
MSVEQLVYTVPDISCEHCTRAIESEVVQVAGVTQVVADLETKRVTVVGTALDDGVIRAAIDEAGYTAA